MQVCKKYKHINCKDTAIEIMEIKKFDHYTYANVLWYNLHSERVTGDQTSMGYYETLKIKNEEINAWIEV